MIIKLNIAKKLAATYLIIILTGLIFGIICIYFLNQYRKDDNQLVEETIPAIQLLKELQKQHSEIEKLANNWIYLSNISDQHQLEKILQSNEKYIVSKLLNASEKFDGQNEIKLKKQLHNDYQNLIIHFNQIAKILITFEDFLDEDKVNQADDIYLHDITPIIKHSKKVIQTLNVQNIEEEKRISLTKEKSIYKLTLAILFAIISILITSLLSLLFTQRNISNPLKQLESTVERVSQGELIPQTSISNEDEIAQMQVAINKMLDNFRNKIEYSQDIGKKQFHSKLDLLSEKDELGKSLIQMSQNLEKADNEIHEATLMLEEAQKNAKLGNWKHDLIENKIYWSKELHEIYEVGYFNDHHELAAQFLPKLHPDDHEYFLKLFSESILTENEFEFEIRILSTNNSIKYVKGKTTIQRNERNEPISNTGIAQDITEIKLKEIELQKAKEEAEQLAKVKDEFMSSMSHEIRTPLNGIIGFTDILLKSKNFSVQQLKQLESIKTSSDILLVIINDILDIAKIESGKMTLEHNPLNLRELTELIVDTFAVKINDKKLNIAIDFDTKVPTLVLGDSVRMSQIFFNFISNAIKFTPIEGSITIQSHLIQEKNQLKTIQFKFIDSGIGIAQDKLDSVFEAFVQTSNDTARKYGGTGLGLTIVKKLVELMNGKVWVESEVNKGTCFTLEIPFEAIQHEQIEVLKSENQTEIKNPENENYSNSTPKKRLRILLAEDNVINQLLAQTVLAQFDYDVETVENGQLAVEAIQHRNFDLILMDLMMPELDGYEATKQIRNLEDISKKNIPIIALTADVTNSVISKCTEIGMNAYMSKPFDTKELQGKILEILAND